MSDLIYQRWAVGIDDGPMGKLFIDNDPRKWAKALKLYGPIVLMPRATSIVCPIVLVTHEPFLISEQSDFTVIPLNGFMNQSTKMRYKSINNNLCITGDPLVRVSIDVPAVLEAYQYANEQKIHEAKLYKSISN